MLTLTFLGVGSAFAKRNFQSNALIEAWKTSPDQQSEPDDTLLIDFGCTGPVALHQLQQKPEFAYLAAGDRTNFAKIRRLFITHQHADHIGGIEELAFNNTFVHPGTDKPFKPQIISSINILVNLWDTSLKGGMSPMPGRYALLQDYFFILALRPTADGFEPFNMLKRYQFEIFPTDHIQIERKYDWPSYGLTIRDLQTNETVFYSGDTRFDFDAYHERLSAASTCFHDVQLADNESTVHATLAELRTMPDEIKRKTILYHYPDQWDEPQHSFVDDEFAGFATPQVRYTLFD